MTRAGFSLVEAVISIAIVGVLLVAALNTLGTAHAGRASIDRERVGRHLADGLLTEILAAETISPATDPSGQTRAAFSAVLDYDGWTSSPPVSRAGSPKDGLDDWTRAVRIAWVNPSDPSSVVGSASGVVRITVTVSWRDRVVAESVAVRSVPGGPGLRVTTAGGTSLPSGPDLAGGG